MAIWQDLVDDHGFAARYASVKRFVRRLRGAQPPEARVGDRDGARARRRRSTTARARWCAHPATRQVPAHAALRADARLQPQVGAAARPGKSSARVWARAARASVSPARRRAARRRPRQPARGRAHARHLRPDAQSALPRRARALRRGRAAVPRRAIPIARARSSRASATRSGRRCKGCASRRSRRRRRTSIAGRRAGPTRASTARRSGRSRRCLPRSARTCCRCRVEPFRYYQYGERTVHLDGCVEVDGAYYARAAGLDRPRGARAVGRRARAPPRSDDRRAAARAPAPASAAAIASTPRIARRARRRRRCAARARRARRHAHRRALRRDPPPATASRRAPHPRRARARQEARRRRRRGRLRRPRSSSASPTTASSGATSNASPPAPLTLRQVDPLIRELTQYRDLIDAQDQGDPDMNLVELDRALRQLRCSGMADVLETRLLRGADRASSRPSTSSRALVSDELLAPPGPPARPPHQAGAASATPARRLDTFDFDFNKKMNRASSTSSRPRASSTQHEDALFLGPPGTGKSHLAQAIGLAAIQQGHRVLYREAHVLARGARRRHARRHAEGATSPTSPPSRCSSSTTSACASCPHTAAEDLLELVMRRYERASTLLTSNRPVEDWGKLLGDTAAVTALLDRLLHHAHVLKCGPRSWRTRLHAERPPRDAHDASRFALRSRARHRGHILAIPPAGSFGRHVLLNPDPFGTTLVLGAAPSLAGFAPSTTGRFSGVHRGPEVVRAHPGDHPVPAGGWFSLSLEVIGDDGVRAPSA